MKNKKLLAGGLLAALLLVIVGTLSFHAGRQRGRAADTGREAEEEAGLTFGSGTALISPFSDGSFCDFSGMTASVTVVEAAGRQLPAILELETVEYAAAFYLRQGTAAVYRGMDSLPGGSVLGTDEAFPAASGLMIEKGRGLTAQDVREGNRVAVLDDRAAQILFYGEDPIGKIVEIETVPFQVVGVAGLGETSSLGKLVLIPKSVWPQVYQYEEPESVVIRTEPEDCLTAAENTVHILNSMIDGEEKIRYAVQ